MTSRMIAYIVKNQLRENLEMTVKKTRGLVNKSFPQYNRVIINYGEEGIGNCRHF
jgi:hypothetical protein